MEVISSVSQMFDIEVPDNVTALWAPVATSTALLAADLPMRADVELSAVHLNMDASSTSGKAMLEKVGAQMQEVASWKRLDFKLIAKKFACGEPLGHESSDDDGEDDEPGIHVHVQNCASAFCSYTCSVYIVTILTTFGPK